MTDRRVATVFGGSGFIGRYVVQRLARAGCRVRIAGRDPVAAEPLRTQGVPGQIVPVRASIADEDAVGRAVAGADWVVNLVGILFERRSGDFRRIHVDGAGRVARL
ncbi:MAG TPA: NAD-dependent epimerase/dehydratase family protein, partial [Acetobacteraceae bacterium]|nr:NAD-dependent epimerase/dehydratase family protein [Acetobacteraceae bacterium]